MSHDAPNAVDAYASSLERSWWERLAFAFGSPSSFYFLVLIVLLFFENWLTFRPTRAASGWVDPAQYGLVVEDVFFVVDGKRLHAWWCDSPEHNPRRDGVILFCHGNGGNLSCMAPEISAWQAAARCGFFIFDYPGYGRSEGSPTEPGCYSSADAAFDWLATVKGVAPESVLLVGESLGGAVAVDLAVRRPHRALVLLRTFTNIPDMAQKQFPIFPARWLCQNRFDNLAKIGRCQRPVLVAHGDADPLIPFSQGERVFAAANAPKVFLRLPGVDHVMRPPVRFFDVLNQFLCLHAPRDCRD